MASRPGTPKTARTSSCRIQLELKPIQGQDKKPINLQIQIVPLPKPAAAKPGTPEQKAFQNQPGGFNEESGEAKVAPQNVYYQQRKAVPMALAGQRGADAQRFSRVGRAREIRGKTPASNERSTPIKHGTRNARKSTHHAFFSLG